MSRIEVTATDVFLWAGNEYDELEDFCIKLHDDYISYIETQHVGMKRSDKTTLDFRIRRRGDFSLSILWTQTRFYRDRSGKWIPRTKEVAKGRSTKTSYENIRRAARGWEMEMAWEVENKLAEVRRALESLRRITANLRFEQKHMQNLERIKSENDTD